MKLKHNQDTEKLPKKSLILTQEYHNLAHELGSEQTKGLFRNCNSQRCLEISQIGGGVWVGGGLISSLIVGRIHFVLVEFHRIGREVAHAHGASLLVTLEREIMLE